MPSCSIDVDTGMEPGTIRTDVRVVRAARRESDECRLVKDWTDRGDIRQMSAAEKRIVQQHEVAVAPLEPSHDVGHRIRHAAEMHRDVRGLPEQRAIGIEQRAAEVETVLDVRRKRCAPQRHTHFIADRLHAASEQCERDAVEG